MNKIDAYNYLKKSVSLLVNANITIQYIESDQLIDDDDKHSNKVSKGTAIKATARKRTIQTWQRKSSFCAAKEEYLKNFWMAPLLRQQHSLAIYKSVLSIL